jgi:hypothetical protein
LWRAPRGKTVGGVGFPRRLAGGDLLTWRGLWTGGPHIAVVGAAEGAVTVIQNHGWGVAETWLGVLWLDRAVGHYRWRPSLDRRGRINGPLAPVFDILKLGFKPPIPVPWNRE